MTWRWLVFDEAKSHAVPLTLRNTIVADLKGRSCRLKTEVALPDLSLDYGGAIITTAPREKVQLDGLRVSIWCDEVGLMAADMRRLEPRHVVGRINPYFKFHGAYNCLVLTPQLREEMISKLITLEPNATARWEEFCARFKLQTRAAKVDP